MKFFTQDNIEQSICAVLAILALYFIGDKKSIGMALGLLSEVAWTIVFLRKKLYILILVNVLYVFLYLRGLLLWL